MFRFVFFIIVIFLYSCNQDNKHNSEEKQATSNRATSYDDLGTDYKLTARFSSFDTTVEVLFMATKDSSISDTQRKTMMALFQNKIHLCLKF